MRFLSKLLYFNKHFMDKYVTTIYPKVYVPRLPFKENDPISAIATLAHEYVHLKDRKKMGFLFNFFYLFPQNLVFFSLLGIFNPWWYLCLLCLLPIPSPTRAWLEYRGYRMTLFVYEYYGAMRDHDDFLEWIAEHFVNSSYYWMFPAKSFIKNKLKRDLFLYGSQQKDISEVREIINILGGDNKT
tara:strand:- start:1483 stop:2037 length:555 start_codon:yes stop_codon:yes gene_type:complete